MAGSTPTDEATHQQRDRAQARYVARGYMPLKRFQDKHDLSHDELHVAGVLRYLQPRDPNTVPHTVVGAKAKDCLLLSTKWQLILVKPGQEEKFAALCYRGTRLLSNRPVLPSLSPLGLCGPGLFQAA